MDSYPLIHRKQKNSILAWDDGIPVSVNQFLANAFSLSKNLPNSTQVLNLCDNPYRFFLGFVAALIKGQTNILPPNKAFKTLRSIALQFQGAYCLTDTAIQEDIGLPVFDFISGEQHASKVFDIPEVKASHVAAIVYTSGSTGKPQAHLKSWESMVRIARNTGRRLISDNANRVSFVATVPTQHMYGLETSIMLPLQYEGAMYGERPFFPVDIREALKVVTPDRILITTPLHLKACVESAVQFPEIFKIISATAPLPRGLAESAESLFKTQVFEIYGCTETGSLATKQTTKSDSWELLENTDLTFKNGQCYCEAAYLSHPIKLPDIIESSGRGFFELRGRNEDIINIGGKRASLAELSCHLNQIKKVVDGVYFVPPEGNQKHKRLIAFVVANGLQEADILKILRQCIDPVFLPRPIYFVDYLPRNANGKLTRESLLQTFSRVCPKVS
jgi:acyl-coenzyme A synthetase/AMP-(fatty) acid ligase